MAEIPELNEAAARGLDTITRAALTAGYEAVKLTYQSESWRQLGFGSFDEWVTSMPRYQLERAERKALVAEYREVGMTQRQIAAAVGVSHQTVGRDLGPDGPAEESDRAREEAPSGPDGPEPGPDRVQEAIPDDANASEPTLRESGEKDPGVLTAEDMAEMASRPAPTEAEEVARLRAVWARETAALAHVIALDPAKFVPLEAGDNPSLPGLIEATEKWCALVKEELARARGLRVVGGTRR